MAQQRNDVWAPLVRDQTPAVARARSIAGQVATPGASLRAFLRGLRPRPRHGVSRIQSPAMMLPRGLHCVDHPGQTEPADLAAHRGRVLVGARKFGGVGVAAEEAHVDPGGLLGHELRGRLAGVLAQAMILRAIEDKRILAVGADKESASEFQLIAGTNRDLGEAVRRGAFREGPAGRA